MKYIVDASILLAVGRGEWLEIEKLGWNRKRDVAVPEPVVVWTALEVRKIPKADAVRRWTMLMAEMPRAPWTPAVTEKLIELEADDLGVYLDVITAAHALAHDASVLTLEPARYEGISGLGVEEL